MKNRSSTLILKSVIFLIGFIALGLCLIVLPYGITTDQTGFYRPLLFGLYLPAIPFFIALSRALRLLGYIESNKAFSNLSVTALKEIKSCAIIICAIFTLGMPYIFWVADKDDAPGVAAIGFVIIFASGIIATFAAVLKQLLQNAVEIKSENDLTV